MVNNVNDVYDLFPEPHADGSDEPSKKDRVKPKLNVAQFGRASDPVWGHCRSGVHRLCAREVFSQITDPSRVIRCACPCHSTRGAGG